MNHLKWLFIALVSISYFFEMGTSFFCSVLNCYLQFECKSWKFLMSLIYYVWKMTELFQLQVQFQNHGLEVHWSLWVSWWLCMAEYSIACLQSSSDSFCWYRCFLFWKDVFWYFYVPPHLIADHWNRLKGKTHPFYSCLPPLLYFPLSEFDFWYSQLVLPINLHVSVEHGSEWPGNEWDTL